jgi:hypothetical protein
MPHKLSDTLHITQIFSVIPKTPSHFSQNFKHPGIPFPFLSGAAEELQDYSHQLR